MEQRIETYTDSVTMQADLAELNAQGWEAIQVTAAHAGEYDRSWTVLYNRKGIAVLS
jgi:hypothetical protein